MSNRLLNAIPIVAPALVAALFSLPLAAGEPAMNETNAEAQQLVGHVHEIFRAFIDRDAGRIRELHAEDWVGFLGPSARIERGIDDYMVNARKSLDSFRGTGYEIHDTEVQVHGDIALVFYVATYRYAAEDGTTGVVPLRSVDVFRRDGGGWIQSASHISVIPAGGDW